jgi:hypothetical protein
LAWCGVSAATICDHKSREVGGGLGISLEDVPLVMFLLLLLVDDMMASSLKTITGGNGCNYKF